MPVYFYHFSRHEEDRSAVFSDSAVFLPVYRAREPLSVAAESGAIFCDPLRRRRRRRHVFRRRRRRRRRRKSGKPGGGRRGPTLQPSNALKPFKNRHYSKLAVNCVAVFNECKKFRISEIVLPWGAARLSTVRYSTCYG